MPLVRRIGVGLVVAALVIIVVACQPTPTTVPAMPTLPHTTAPGAVVWGRVPYCSCLIDSATAKVADALKKANLLVNLKEQSPRDGWLYFVATFDPDSVRRDQVNAAMLAGGAEVLEGPP